MESHPESDPSGSGHAQAACGATLGMLGAGRRVLRLGPSDDRNQVQEHKAPEVVHLPGPFRGQGVIVNVASTVCFAGMPLVAAYASSKFAMEGFSETLFYELGTVGVRVKLVSLATAPRPPSRPTPRSG
jgi:NAD(P)-dependent dehydrogenase (short-subunit alcohol dehydrogenase family)